MEDDQEIRESGLEVVYLQAHSTNQNKGIFFEWWFRTGDPRNQEGRLPGKLQSVNRGILYAFRQLLVQIRKRAVAQFQDERCPLFIVRTSSTFLEEGVDCHLWDWKQRRWHNHCNRKLTNFILWQGIDFELTYLRKLNVEIRMEKILEFTPPPSSSSCSCASSSSDDPS